MLIRLHWCENGFSHDVAHIQYFISSVTILLSWICLDSCKGHRKMTSVRGGAHFYYDPQPKGRGTYCFWCRSCRRQLPHSFLSALYFLNQWVDFDQTCTDTLLVGEKEGVKFWWPWPHFQGHISTLNYQILTKKTCLHPISWTKWQILAKLHTIF